MPGHALIAGDHGYAQGLFELPDNCGRLYSRTTNKTDVSGTAAVFESPVENHIRLQRSHFGIGVDSKIGAPVDRKAVRFEKSGLASMYLIDIGRQ